MRLRGTCYHQRRAVPRVSLTLVFLMLLLAVTTLLLCFRARGWHRVPSTDIGIIATTTKTTSGSSNRFLIKNSGQANNNDEDYDDDRQEKEAMMMARKVAGKNEKEEEKEEKEKEEEKEEGTEGAEGRWFQPPDCSLMDRLARPDPSVGSAYNSTVVCGEEVMDRDVFCRLFFVQNDLKDDGDCVRDYDDTKVPRIIYFVIFGNYTFEFWHYVSVMAAKRYVTHSTIYVIGDAHPVGYWWKRVLQDCKGVRFVYRPGPGPINWQKVIFPHHWSDIVRLQALLLNGGIYLDADMILTRDPGPLLTHDVTLGLVENVTGMGNAFIAAKRNSSFLLEWYERYGEFSNRLDRYFFNSLRVPWEMWRKNPEALHLESEKLYRPNYNEADQLFKGWDYDWRQNYAVHVWTNGNPVPRSEEEVRTSNTTIAQVFRNALYGDPSAPVPGGGGGVVGSGG